MIDLFQGTEFSDFRTLLDAEMKQLPRERVGSQKHQA